MRIIKERYLDFFSPQLVSILQLAAADGPLFPTLKTLILLRVFDEPISLIPLFLSPMITTINIEFLTERCEIIPIITTLPSLCPNLQKIHLTSLFAERMITAAVSELALKTNRNTLQSFCTNCPLTEEAYKVICEHPGLREFGNSIYGSTVLPTLVLPSLTVLHIKYLGGHDWLQCFSGASLEKLTVSIISTQCELSLAGNFLEAFQTIALTTSLPTTLSEFSFYTEHPWRPIYRSLLPFTQLQFLSVQGYCYPNCSSTVDDDIVIDLARAMPHLQVLQLGGDPCGEPGGVTIRGLTALAHYCPHLVNLTIHFQMDTLHPLATARRALAEKTNVPVPQACALRILRVGSAFPPEEPMSMVKIMFTLLNVFPNLESIVPDDDNHEWDGVGEALRGWLIRGLSEKCRF